jgi:AraC-like DNA-binding protein
VLSLSHHPRPPLSEFVDSLWLVEGGQSPRLERILPSGTIEVVINLRDDEVQIHDAARPDHYKRFSGAVVSGTYSSVFICDAMQHESMMGVHFKPGGAFPFLGALASELTNTHADLADLWGRSALQLRERLCTLNTPQERFRIMEEVLNDRLLRSPKRRLEVQTALDIFGTTGTAQVRDVAREVGVCQRQLIKMFKAEVGLTPKRFCRLLRFQRARVLAGQLEKPDWVQIAMSCGYFDQSHFIHDFQEFAGLSPTNYLRQHRSDAWLKDNHVPVG